jgi:hypothetical protein
VIFISNLEEKYNQYNFFEVNSIFNKNQKIMMEYLKSIEREGRAKATVTLNVEILKFLVKHVRTDLDDLTKSDINDYIDAIISLSMKF